MNNNLESDLTDIPINDDEKKNELSELYQEVKVKRGGKEGALFRVKAWSPPLKESKSKKKGKKNVDKKIRNRSEGQ